MGWLTDGSYLFSSSSLCETHFPHFLYSNLIKQELLTSWNYCRESFCLFFHWFFLKGMCWGRERRLHMFNSCLPHPPGLFSLAFLEDGHILVLLLTSYARQTWISTYYIKIGQRPIWLWVCDGCTLQHTWTGLFTDSLHKGFLVSILGKFVKSLFSIVKSNPNLIFQARLTASIFGFLSCLLSI